MYRSSDTVFGLPARIYREPDEIRLDIYEVKRSIEKINSRLNIRGLMLDMVTEEELSPSEVVTALESMLAEAEDALFQLKELKRELAVLEEELYEVKCELQT